MNQSNSYILTIGFDNGIITKYKSNFIISDFIRRQMSLAFIKKEIYMLISNYGVETIYIDLSKVSFINFKSI
jgi:hypothetical protein